jgi:hypothetical protein
MEVYSTVTSVKPRYEVIIGLQADGSVGRTDSFDRGGLYCLLQT